MVSAGELIQRVTIERDVVTRVSGARTVQPEAIGQAWAKVEFLSGRELQQNQQVQESVNVRVTLRYEWASRIVASDRVLYGPWRMEIKAIIPDEGSRSSVSLLCEARNGG